MSISRQFLLEQINRSIAIDKDENRLYCHDTEDDKFWSNHQYGHLELVDRLKDYVLLGDYSKKDLRKFLKGWRKQAKSVIKILNKKYNDFKHGEDMSKEDNCKYGFYDGIDCKAYTLLQIIQGKVYYNKKSYEPTDWKGLGMLE